jgi:hypothetical protein
MFRISFDFLAASGLAVALFATAACSTTVNNSGGAVTNNGADTNTVTDTGTGAGNDTTSGGATCTVPTNNICCVGSSAATGHLYNCPDQASAAKCAGTPDPTCVQNCMMDPDPNTCSQKCMTPDPSSCTEVNTSTAEKSACCGGGGGGGGDTSGGSDTVSGNNDTGPTGVTGVVWAGTWQVKVEYDVDCDMNFGNHKKGHQSVTKSVSISGENSSLTIDLTNYQLTGSGHDDHATFNGSFPFIDVDGQVTSGLGADGVQATFAITTVSSKDSASGNADGSKFGGEFSGSPNCTVSNSTVTMTR